jgi:hypothetical protein
LCLVACTDLQTVGEEESKEVSWFDRDNVGKLSSIRIYLYLTVINASKKQEWGKQYEKGGVHELCGTV